MNIFPGLGRERAVMKRRHYPVASIKLMFPGFVFQCSMPIVIHDSQSAKSFLTLQGECCGLCGMRTMESELRKSELILERDGEYHHKLGRSATCFYCCSLKTDCCLGSKHLPWQKRVNASVFCFIGKYLAVTTVYCW